MRFVCEQETLAVWLKKASLFADAKSPIAIHGYVKLAAVPGKLTLSACNSTFLFTVELPLTDLMPVQPGAICVPAVRTSDLVGTLRPNCPVELSYEGSKLTLCSGHTAALLEWLPEDHFPVFDTKFREPQITIPAGELDRVLERSLPAMGNDPVRGVFWGLSLQYTAGNISAAAANGTFAAFSTPHYLTVSEFPAAIIPRPVCIKLRTLLKGEIGQIAISITPNAARIATNSAGNGADEWSIVTKMVNAVCLPHADILAPSVPHPVILNSSELQAVLARIIAGTDIDSKVLKQRGALISFAEGRATIRNGHRTIHDVMDALYRGPKEPEEIGINTAQMAEAAAACDSPEIELHFTDRNSRIRVCSVDDTEESFTIMPYRM